MKTRGYNTGGHGRIALIRWEGIRRHRRSPIASCAFAGDGSVWVLAKGGLPGDGNDFIRLVLNGEPVPEPGPDTGCFEEPCRHGAPLSSASKLVRGLVARVGEGEPGDFLWTAFAVIGSSGTSSPASHSGDRVLEHVSVVHGDTSYSL